MDQQACLLSTYLLSLSLPSPPSLSQDRVYLCNLGCTRALSVNQASFILGSACFLLGLKVWDTAQLLPIFLFSLKMNDHLFQYLKLQLVVVVVVMFCDCLYVRKCVCLVLAEVRRGLCIPWN